jgi:hypothetical protein
MRNLKSKVKIIESKISPEKETLMFFVEGPDRDKDFARQKAEYIKYGGNPNAIFIMVCWQD